jgi:hypothetical protein
MSWAATAADTGQAQEALNVESFLIERPDQTAYCRVKGDPESVTSPRAAAAKSLI